MFDDFLEFSRVQPFALAAGADFNLHAVVLNRIEHGTASWTFHIFLLCHDCSEKSRINESRAWLRIPAKGLTRSGYPGSTARKIFPQRGCVTPSDIARNPVGLHLARPLFRGLSPTG